MFVIKLYFIKNIDEGENLNVDKNIAREEW